MRVTLLWSSERNGRFIQGLRPLGYIPACILSSLRDYFRTAVLCRDSALRATSLPVFCRPIVQQVGHFGRRLGRVQVNLTLRSACSKIRDFRSSCFTRHFGRTGWRVTLLRSSIRSNVSLQGLRPLGSIPACILTSRWDSCLGYGVVTLLRSSVWKRRFITGVETPACIITSRRDSSFVLFYKTFWAAPRQCSSELDSALGLLQNSGLCV